MGVIKICGLTNLDDARWALEQGADYLGFVLYRQSARGIDVSRLREILQGLPDDAAAVAVVVNETSEFLDELVQQCRLKAVQFHGDEEAGTLAPGGVATWRAVKLLDGKWTPEPLMAKADRYVMDAAAAGYGGSGVTIDWAAAGEFAGKYPAMLAGGLVPGNVADAITKVRPLGVDVASGVEQSPGRKDPVKVKEFIQVAQLGFRVVEKEGRGLR
jgi:phosphoribosylanthranilate isomerase